MGVVRGGQGRHRYNFVAPVLIQWRQTPSFRHSVVLSSSLFRSLPCEGSLFQTNGTGKPESKEATPKPKGVKKKRGRVVQDRFVTLEKGRSEKQGEKMSWNSLLSVFHIQFILLYPSSCVEPTSHIHLPPLLYISYLNEKGTFDNVIHALKYNK